MSNRDCQRFGRQNDLVDARRIVEDEYNRRPCAQKVALNASTGGFGPLPIITTLLAAPIPVVDVSIDTRGMRNPTVLLNFTSIISLPLGISVTLNFRILRSKNGNTPVPVGSTYTFSTIVDVLEAESFAFQYADIDVAPGEYTYSVELSTNSIIDITPGLTGVNVTLSALAVDNG
ncbi:MAG: hypothetical protein K0S71_2468 [Clostridia bacterium]|jgi:hypothetical protein|nr:hypothetical protein [Clostridia bacterium]